MAGGTGLQVTHTCRKTIRTVQMNSSANHDRRRRRGQSRRPSSSTSTTPDARTVTELIRTAVEHVAAPLLICEVQPEWKGVLGGIRVLYANSASKVVVGAEPKNLNGQDLIPFLAPDTDRSMRDRLRSRSC